MRLQSLRAAAGRGAGTGAAKSSLEALEMALLQADNGNYSPGIVRLIPCHLHVSAGVLHPQSCSLVDTSQ